MTSDASDEKFYAKASEPLIKAVLHALYRFESAPQAMKIIERIARKYITSKQQDTKDGPALKLWIRNFAVTPEEKNEGHLGHFASIGIRKTGPGHFTLFAQKIPTALAHHPQRKRPKRNIPDWGHPIIREIKNGKIYNTSTDARTELLRLQEQFSDTTIPGVDKLHVMIYSQKTTPPVQKYTLRIAVRSDERFHIDIIAKKTPKPISKPDHASPHPLGKYTSMVTSARKRSKK